MRWCWLEGGAPDLAVVASGATEAVLVSGRWSCSHCEYHRAAKAADPRRQNLVATGREWSRLHERASLTFLQKTLSWSLGDEIPRVSVSVLSRLADVRRMP